MPFIVILLLLLLLFFLWKARPTVRRSTGAKSARKRTWWPGGAEQKGRYVDYEELPDDGRDEATEPAGKSAPTPSESRIKDAEYEEIP